MKLFGLTLPNLGNVVNSIEGAAGVNSGGNPAANSVAATQAPTPQRTPTPVDINPGIQQAPPPPVPNTNPTIALPPSQQNKLTHNPVTNFIGGVVKPLEQFPLDAGASLYNNAVAPVFNLPQQNLKANPILGGAAKMADATGGVRQLVSSGAATALTLGTGGIDGLVKGGVDATAPGLSDAAAKYVTNGLSGGVVGGGLNAAQTAGQTGSTAKQTALSAAEGFGAGVGTGMLGTAASSVIRAGLGKLRTPQPTDTIIDQAPIDTPQTAQTMSQAGKDAADAIKNTQPTAPSTTTPGITPETPTATPREPVTTAPVVASPKTMATDSVVANPIPLANTGNEAFDKAFNNLSAEHTRVKSYAGSVDDIANRVTNDERLGSTLSQRLGRVIRKMFNPEQNQQIEDYLDGAINRTALSADQQIVADHLARLRSQGWDIRKIVATNKGDDIGHVTDYSPRISVNSIKSMTAGAAKSAGKKVSKSLTDRFSLESGHSMNRTMDKFSDLAGNTHYGSAHKLGFKDTGDGRIYQDSKGNLLTREHATKQELEDVGAGKYIRKASTNTALYHTDTLRLKAHADAVNEIATNPNAHGVWTREQVDNGTAPEGVKQIFGVEGLKDNYFASGKDANTIQQRLGFNTKSTPLGLRVYDALSNFVTQSIVLNPIYHGANQLVQTAMAAGNMPGFQGLPGHGWGTTLYHVMTVGEDDMHAVLEAGGGGSDYGAGAEGVLSQLTHGASKINANAMAAIELRLRAGLYKASIENGMKSEDAVKNINDFLGGTKEVNENIRRATLFAHYFKTMAGAIGKQVTHPIQQRGSIVNGATVAAFLTAMSYGYQKFTGNPNASVRLPGEIGLINSGVKSIQAARHGDALGAASIATNRINPVLKEPIEQFANRDMGTGKTLNNDRLGHATTTLFSPATQISQRVSGKRSVGELVANQLGLNSPHAAGNEAAPSGNANFLNTKGSTLDTKGSDPTGYQEEISSIAAKQALLKSVANDPKASSAVNNFSTYDRTSDGKIILDSSGQKASAWGQLLENGGLSDYQQYEKKIDPSNPTWNSPELNGNGKLNGQDYARLQIWAAYKSLPAGDIQKDTIAQQNSWIGNLENQVSAYDSKLSTLPGTVNAPNYVKYPSISAATTSTMNQIYTLGAIPVQNRTTAQVNQLKQLEKDPAVTAAHQAIENYTNQVRASWNGVGKPGLPKINYVAGESPQVQNFYAAYEAASTTARSAMRTSNPTMYSAMTNYLNASTLSSAEKDLGAAYYGAPLTSSALGDISNIGQYDVNSTKLSNGATQYSQFNSTPKNPFATNSSSSGSSAAYNKLVAETKQNSVNRDIEHSDKIEKNLFPKVKKARTTGRVFIKGAKQAPVMRNPGGLGIGTGKTPKVQLKSVQTNKKGKQT